MSRHNGPVVSHKVRAALQPVTDDEDEDDLDITQAVSNQLRKEAKSSGGVARFIDKAAITDDDETPSDSSGENQNSAKLDRKSYTTEGKHKMLSSGAALPSFTSLEISISPSVNAANPSRPDSSSSSDPFQPRPFKSSKGRNPLIQSKTSASQKRQPVQPSRKHEDDSDFDIDTMAAKYSQRKKRKINVDSSPISIRPTDSSTAKAVAFRTDQDEEDQKRRKSARVKVEDGKEKIVMTDDEDDDAYKRFKDSKKRKGVAGRKSKKDTGKSKTESKGKSRLSGDKLRERAIRNEDGFESSEPEDIGIPTYLQKKKESLAADQIRKIKPSEEIYRFPPSYKGINFAGEDDKLADVEEKPYFPGGSPCREYKDIHLERSRGIIPASIAQWLRDYQLEGVQFMHQNFMLNTGCLLGDDMGLGKTIQVIAFLTVAFGKTGDARDAKRMRKMRDERSETWYPKVMIVCPGTLIHNWQRELETWGWWHIYVYHGSKSEKEDALKAARTGYLEIMITTYDTYRRDEGRINTVEWDCVIADECQKVKERKSGITIAMNQVNSLCRIGLTGTAIMNNYAELWNLLNWIRPGDLGTYAEWKRDIEEPLKIGQSHTAKNAELALARMTASNLVKNLLPRMFLRRMKTLIAHQLPKKSDKVVFCKLTAVQQEVYENYIESDVVQLVKLCHDKCDCGSGLTRGKCCHKALPDGGPALNDVIFPCITNVLSLCNHLANWVPHDGDPIEKQEKDLEKLQIGLPERWEQIYRRPPFENVIDPTFCGKWLVLKRLLAFWHENEDKVLIFSYSKKLLRMLQLLMGQTHYNICYLDGDMALEERTAAVDNFNSDPNIFAFLISTRAGGVGLNITSANKVVVFDPSWNPSHDLQAQDRAYRIGQTRDVDVFRLVCAGTIEEIVYARQIYKQQQANIGYQASFERRYFTGVMKDSTRRGELFGLKNLFTFQQDNVVLQEIVNKTNVAESKTGVAILNMDSQTDEDLTKVDDIKDDPLSQIQAIVGSQDGSTSHGPNLDPIQAILSEAGVDYTHENTDVIGTSKLEENISRKAVEANEDPTMRAMTAFQEDMMHDKRFRYGDVPIDVRLRQYNSLRKACGYDSNTKFALVVEKWSPEQRTNALEKFYHSRRSILALRGEMDEHEAPDFITRGDVIVIDEIEDSEQEVDNV